SSASTASSVWMRQTRRCSLAGMRGWAFVPCPLSLVMSPVPFFPLPYFPLTTHPTLAQAHNQGQKADRSSSLAYLGKHRAAVENVVAVALLRQEQLAVVSEIQLARVAGDQGVKVGDLAARLGPEDAPQPLRLFLTGAERTRHLNQHIGVGQV